MQNLKYKIQDIYYDIKERNEYILPILQGILALGLITLFVGGLFGWYDSDETSNFYDEGNLADLGTFEYISYENISDTENGFFITTKVYLSEPTSTEEQINAVLNSIKYRIWNDASTIDKNVTGYHIDIYNRELGYKLGYPPTTNESYLLNGDVMTTKGVDKLPKDYEDTYVLNLNVSTIKKNEDIEIMDLDDIVIDTIDVPDSYTEEEIYKFYKIYEYQIISNKTPEFAVGFFVLNDYGINNEGIDSFKYQTVVETLIPEYKKFLVSGESVPPYDREQLVMYYRENHADIWSKLASYRGF